MRNPHKDCARCGAIDFAPLFGGGFGSHAVPEFREIAGNVVAALGTGVTLKNVAPGIIRSRLGFNEALFAELT